MIDGWISDELEPFLSDVFVRLPDGTSIPVKVILDTGFNGTLCLPKNILQQMELQPVTTELFELADGSVIEEETYIGEVILGNRPHKVELSGVDSDTALMGMALIVGKEAIFNLKEMTVKVRL